MLCLYHAIVVTMGIVLLVVASVRFWTGYPVIMPVRISRVFDVLCAVGMLYGCLVSPIPVLILSKRKRHLRFGRVLWLQSTALIPFLGLRSYRELVRISDANDFPVQFRLRTLLIAVLIASLVASYGASYYEISRAGMAEADLVQMEGFFYVPMDEATAAGDVTPRHFLLLLLFCPANMIDHLVFGSPEPVTHAPTMLVP